jgi:hypothetical protein
LVASNSNLCSRFIARIVIADGWGAGVRAERHQLRNCPEDSEFSGVSGCTIATASAPGWPPLCQLESCVKTVQYRERILAREIPRAEEDNINRPPNYTYCRTTL